MKLDLTQMRTGESGMIAEIHGGYGLIKKLQNIGIRPGKKITKVSSYIWRGPQVVEIDDVQVAVGFGMAQRIIIQAEG